MILCGIIKHLQMQCVTIGKIMDLNALHRYDQLKVKLEKLFDLKSKLRIHNQWKMTFKDDE